MGHLTNSVAQLWELDKKIALNIFFRVKSPSWTWGSYGAYTGIWHTISLPHYGAFEIRLCQIPTIAPLSPEGGVVGQYIDRYIKFSCINIIKD